MRASGDRESGASTRRWTGQRACRTRERERERQDARCKTAKGIGKSVDLRGQALRINLCLPLLTQSLICVLLGKSSRSPPQSPSAPCSQSVLQTQTRELCARWSGRMDIKTLSRATRALGAQRPADPERARSGRDLQSKHGERESLGPARDTICCGIAERVSICGYGTKERAHASRLDESRGLQHQSAFILLRSKRSSEAEDLVPLVRFQQCDSSPLF
ncbi:uncharacterized protein K460DRAFT_91785 [Cucurbitaria berberidis CBS 394.84]|uniref:Uncharacterized protein n=1 Tax=Cucurbitaria berberidis CBS 394.84 TaxID=1168544 RepID=A0A9P4LCA0_9PLEO|nr:uncharacterized protein K460DRAFT_91785 [Cucurbitaria berberidis CBS 394.84]KAF1849488.1 hypothetical protein K460DRAFT_91785 [Cucurbitaria berberidis CBS 394.84]